MEPDNFTTELRDAVVTDVCHLRIPSLPEWIEPTVDYLVQRASLSGAILPNRTNRLMMALHEALTNSIIHGNLGISSVLKESDDRSFAEAVAARCTDPAYANRMVDIHASYTGSVASWVFTDQGKGFDIEAAMRRLDEQEPDFTRASGRGLLLIRAFMDEMRYEDRGRRLVLALKRNPVEEKRSQPRWSLAQNVRITPVDEQGRADWPASQEGVTRNISAEGIAFLGSHLLPTSRVLITIPTSQEPIAIPAEIRHWHNLGDNLVEIGCRFETPLSGQPEAAPAEVEVAAADPSLVELVNQLAGLQRPLEERRIDPRVSYTEPIEVEVPGLLIQQGFGRDLSRGGISFFTTTSLPLEVVNLTLPGGQKGTRIRVQARVIRCTRLMDGFYDVAARFTGT